MTDGRRAFHPELANQIFGATDREIAAITCPDGTLHATTRPDILTGGDEPDDRRR